MFAQAYTFVDWIWIPIVFILAVVFAAIQAIHDHDKSKREKRDE